MLYNLDWLQRNKTFPPACEASRLERYEQNRALFDGDHFSSDKYRHRDGTASNYLDMYEMCARRISRVINNWEDVISFPVLLNYQRLMTLKVADLVCGEYPNITGATDDDNDAIQKVREYTDFDNKLFTSVIDISRYGDSIIRVYKDEDGENTFTVWDPREWFPIVSQDGTNTIKAHCLCWLENRAIDKAVADYHLHVQIHYTEKDKVGSYEHRIYNMGNSYGTIGKLEKREMVNTGLDTCAVMHLKAFSVSDSIYGYDDYMPIDSILSEIMVRIGQISVILDKHADPNMTGPVSMLKVDEATGEYHLDRGKFFAVSPGEEQPRYLTWEGQLTAAFKQLDLLINQLYIISEMGAALLGGSDSGSQAISGTAMRFKMVSPLAKVRRISNFLTRPVKKLFTALDSSITFDKISVQWEDGLPDDPRENIENAKLATGEVRMMPLKRGIMKYFDRSGAEAKVWMDELENEAKAREPEVNPNKPGPQDGTGVNPNKKGSELGLKSFSGLNNK